MITKLFKSFGLIALLALFALTGQTVWAQYVAPQLAPPSCADGEIGCYAPLNVSSFPQVKRGYTSFRDGIGLASTSLSIAPFNFLKNGNFIRFSALQSEIDTNSNDGKIGRLTGSDSLLGGVNRKALDIIGVRQNDGDSNRSPLVKDRLVKIWDDLWVTGNLLVNGTTTTTNLVVKNRTILSPDTYICTASGACEQITNNPGTGGESYWTKVPNQNEIFYSGRIGLTGATDPNSNLSIAVGANTTGLGSSAAGVLDLWTGGIKRLSLLADGKVQIPAGKELCLGADCRSVWPTASTPVSSPWAINGNNINNTNIGNVGIGTSNPASKLEVAGLASFADGFVAKTNSSIQGNLSLSPSNGGVIDLSAGITSKAPYAGRVSYRTNYNLDWNGFLPFNALSVGTARDVMLLIGGGATEGDRLVKVWDNLDVVGLSTSANIVAHNSITATKICTNTGVCVNVSEIINPATFPTIPGSLWATTSAGHIYSINNNSNVGIGTNNPTSKLTVAGNASFSDGISVKRNSIIDGQLQITGTVDKALKIGSGAVNDGKIGYQLNTADNSKNLDIIGVSQDGSGASGNRRVRIWDKLLTGDILATNICTVGGTCVSIQNIINNLNPTTIWKNISANVIAYRNGADSRVVINSDSELAGGLNNASLQVKMQNAPNASVIFQNADASKTWRFIFGKSGDTNPNGFSIYDGFTNILGVKGGVGENRNVVVTQGLVVSAGKLNGGERVAQPGSLDVENSLCLGGVCRTTWPTAASASERIICQWNGEPVGTSTTGGCTGSLETGKVTKNYILSCSNPTYPNVVSGGAWCDSITGELRVLRENRPESTKAWKVSCIGIKNGSVLGTNFTNNNVSPDGASIVCSK